MPEALSPDTLSEAEHIRSLHTALIGAWNRHDAKAIADLFASNGAMVGFDGSEAQTPAAILAHLEPVFRDHPTARYVVKIREVRMVGETTALLRAHAGMIPPGQSRIKPEVNAIQTLLAAKTSGRWLIEMFQNTPAAWHGRPKDVEALTAELQALV